MLPWGSRKYITLTARGLNPDLFILARSGEPGSEIKLQRAGADKVVSPYHIGGSRMAQAILRPNKDMLIVLGQPASITKLEHLVS